MKYFVHHITDERTWVHESRDLAISRVTALLIAHPELAVTEHVEVKYSPDERMSKTTFSLERSNGWHKISSNTQPEPLTHEQAAYAKRLEQQVTASTCCPRCRIDPDPRGPSACFDCRELARVRELVSPQGPTSTDERIERLEKENAELRCKQIDAKEHYQLFQQQIDRLTDQVRFAEAVRDDARAAGQRRLDEKREAETFARSVGAAAWRRGVTESADKLYAAAVSGVIGASDPTQIMLSMARIVELLNILLQNPPPEQP